MKGKKLHQLICELSVTESKSMLYFCKNSKDKRFGILYELIKRKTVDLESFNLLFLKLCKKTYPNQKDNEHAVRRLADFFCKEIEKTTLLTLNEQSGFSNYYFAKHYLNKGNLYLSEYYLNKALQNSKSDNDFTYKLSTLPALISLNYLKGTNKTFEQGLLLNETYKIAAEQFYFHSLVDYYNNITNLYFEDFRLIQTPLAELKTAIKKQIFKAQNDEQRLGLIISLMRLSYGSKDLTKLTQRADKITVALTKTNENQMLVRKYLFLKLLLRFFEGGDVEDITTLAESIRTINKSLKIADSYTSFFLGCIYLIQGDFAMYKSVLKAEQNSFKQEFLYLKQFLIGLCYYAQDNLSKAQPLLVELIYSDDYFVNQFSRSTLMSIYAKNGETELLHSLIRSTERQILIHPEKFIINSSTSVFIDLTRNWHFKSRKKPVSTVRKPFSIIHNYLRNNT